MEARHIIAMRSSYRQHKASAKKRGFIPLEFDVYRKLAVQDCAWCGQSPNQERFYGTRGEVGCLVNGIDRIDARVGYIPGNVQTMCGACNHIKGLFEGALLSGGSYGGIDRSLVPLKERVEIGLRTIAIYSGAAQ